MFIIAAHLAYPIIEGLGRRIASRYLEVDGTIKTPVAECTGNDGKKLDALKLGRRLNNIGQLLRLIETKVADNILKEDLKRFREHFEAMFSASFTKDNTYDIIQDLRNTLLHGQEHWQVFYGALTNLICLLVNSGIDKGYYDSKYDELIKHLQFTSRSKLASGFGFGYYPPQ